MSLQHIELKQLKIEISELEQRHPNVACVFSYKKYSSPSSPTRSIDGSCEPRQLSDEDIACEVKRANEYITYFKLLSQTLNKTPTQTSKLGTLQRRRI